MCIRAIFRDFIESLKGHTLLVERTQHQFEVLKESRHQALYTLHLRRSILEENKLQLYQNQLIRSNLLFPTWQAPFCLL